MTYLLDTNAVIALLKEHPQMVHYSDRARSQGVIRYDTATLLASNKNR